jgi:type III secretory pathway component EscS
MINVFIFTFVPVIIIISIFGFLILKFFKIKNPRINKIVKLLFISGSIFLLYKSYSSFLIKKEGYYILTSLDFNDIVDVRVQKLTKHNLNSPILDRKLNKKEINELTQLINPIYGY